VLLENKRLLNFIISAGITCVMFALYRLYSDFVYLTNDDMYLQAIVSGEISGIPDAHMIYSNYIIGLILSSLYKALPSIPWYGLYLEGSIALCICLLLNRCLNVAEKTWIKISVVIGLEVIISFVIFRNIAMVQYTVVAAIVGATAVFLAITMDMNQDSSNYAGQILIILMLAALSFMIRDKVFFMLIPFAACGWFGKWIFEDNKTKRINMRFLNLFAGILAMVVVLGGIDTLAYRGSSNTQKAWSDFLKYNNNREQLYDYYGFPPYEEYEELYESLDIGRESYESAYYHYMLLNQKQYTAETMAVLADAAKENAVAIRMAEGMEARIIQVVSDFIERNLSHMDRPINIIVYCAWICVAVLVVTNRDKKMLFQSIYLLVTRMAMWLYLVFRGRLPDRITQGLYFVELLMLLGICLDYGIRKKKLYRVALVIILLCVPAVYLGASKAQAVKGENAGKLFFGTSYSQLKEYCSQNSENLYLIDTNSISSYNESVFHVRDEAEICSNLIPLGSWVPGSPLTDETLKRYNVSVSDRGLVDCNNVYFIFKKSDVTTTEYLVDYYNSISDNVECDLIDEINTDSGIEYEIYRLISGVN